MADADPTRRTRKSTRRTDDSRARRLERAQELVRRLPNPPITVDEFIAEKRREAQGDG
ncbi:MAG: hypothetical protein QOG72_1305 [Sphingomonadales bacterium]|jgi:hypothetical protein|nr:hypothetical protein [Sphingomonadales bacterium]